MSAPPPPPSGPPPPVGALCRTPAAAGPSDRGGSRSGPPVGSPAATSTGSKQQHFADGRGGSRDVHSTPVAPQPWQLAGAEPAPAGPIVAPAPTLAPSPPPPVAVVVPVVPATSAPTPEPLPQPAKQATGAHSTHSKNSPPSVKAIFCDQAATAFRGMTFRALYTGCSLEDKVRDLPRKEAEAIIAASVPEMTTEDVSSVAAAAKAHPAIDDDVRHLLIAILGYVGLKLVSVSSGQTSAPQEFRFHVFERLSAVGPQLRRSLQLVNGCGHVQWTVGVLRALFELRETAHFALLRDWSSQLLDESHLGGLRQDLKRAGIDFNATVTSASMSGPSSPSEPVRQSTKYTVMTSNLHSFQNYAAYMKGTSDAEVFDSYFRLTNSTRVAKFVATLKEKMPDVVCLQDVDWDGWHSALRGNKEAQVLLAEYHQAEFPEASLLTLVRRPLLLQRFHCEAGPRALLAVVSDASRGGSFAVLNVHARLNAVKDNVGSFKSLLATAGNVPVIAAGDFNTGYGADPKTLHKSDNGNHNQQRLEQDVFPENVWIWIAKVLPFTSRSVAGLDIFEAVDHVVVRRHANLEQVSIAAVSPPMELAHRLLPLCVAQSRERPGPWEERVAVKCKGMAGSAAVLNPAAGEWDKYSPENHYSDHAAIVVGVSLRSSVPVMPLFRVDKKHICRFESLPHLPRERALLFTSSKGKDGADEPVVYVVPTVPMKMPCHAPEVPCRLITARHIYFLESSVGTPSPYETCLLHYIPPTAAKSGPAPPPRPCAYHQQRGAYVFIDDGEKVPGQQSSMAPPSNAAPASPKAPATSGSSSTSGNEKSTAFVKGGGYTEPLPPLTMGASQSAIDKGLAAASVPSAGNGGGFQQSKFK